MKDSCSPAPTAERIPPVSALSTTLVLPPRPASVVRSAFRAGALAGVILRSSRRSPTGCVLVAAFVSRPRAARFAARTAAHLGCSVAFRLVRGYWSVSVPVLGLVPFPSPSPRWPAGLPVAPVAALGGLAWRVGGVRSSAAVARSVSLAAL